MSTGIPAHAGLSERARILHLAELLPPKRRPVVRATAPQPSVRRRHAQVTAREGHGY
jgi:hypothetical protein